MTGWPPPVPLTLQHRPTVGDLVIPAVSVIADGKPVLGAVNRMTALRFIRDYRCQACGFPLGLPIVVIVSAEGLAECYTSEAALHPECARYSEAACPFLNGHRDDYRAPDRHIGKGCDVAGCGCGGWTFGDDAERAATRRGELAGAWYAVWLGERYQRAVDDQRHLHGLAWKGITPRRVRLVRDAAPAPARAQRERTDDE